MKIKIIFVLALLTVVAMAGIPEAVSKSEYLTAFKTIYTDGTCGTCHIGNPSDVSLTDYGKKFQAQANHVANPAGALQAIGAAPGTSPLTTPTMTATAAVSPTATVAGTPAVTGTVMGTPAVTGTVMGTPAVTGTVMGTPEVTTTMTRTPRVTGTTPTSVPEFPGIILPVAGVMGLMLLLLYRRRE